MADNLSLSNLYELLNKKADVTHTHAFAGSIESALYLDGIPAGSFLRNDLASQIIDSNNNITSLTLKSTTSSIKLIADEDLTRIVVNSDNYSRKNLHIAGNNDSDVVISLAGEMIINGARVLTTDDLNSTTSSITDSSSTGTVSLGNGTNIIVSATEPRDAVTGTIWAQILDTDEVEDNNETGSAYMYTVPIGTIIESLSTVVPNGFVIANGQEVSRNKYSELWNFAKAKTLICSDDAWQSIKKDSENGICEYYSKGDGLLTFRVPNLMKDESKTAVVKLIKAYDDLTIKEYSQLDNLITEIDTFEDSKVVIGVNYIKYNNGLLIQHGTTTSNLINFATNFIDDSYSINVTYNGTLTNISTAISVKALNNCLLTCTDATGTQITNVNYDYIAIGRWK